MSTRSVGILNTFWLVALAIVALLSGGLSVIREVQMMYFPPRAARNTVFWAFVRIALAVALGMLFYNEKTKVKELQNVLDQKAKPVLECKFDQWFFGELRQSPGQTFVVIQLTVYSRGAPSIVEGWVLSITEADGKTFQGQPTLFSKVHSFNMAPGMTLYSQDSLFTKQVNDPIQPGAKRSGWLLFQFVDTPKVDLYKKSAEMDLSFRDVNGVVNHAEQTIQGSVDNNLPMYVQGFQIDSSPEPKSSPTA